MPLVSEVHEFSTPQMYYFSSDYALPDRQHPTYPEPKVSSKHTGSIMVTSAHVPLACASPVDLVVAITCSEGKCRPDLPPRETGCSWLMAVGHGSGACTAL